MPESISLALRFSMAEPSATDFGAGRMLPAKEVGVEPLTGRDCEMSGVDELEDSGRPRPSISRSEAFVGGDEPRGDGLNGDRELCWRDRDLFMARLASEIRFLVPTLGGLAAGGLVTAAFTAADLAAAAAGFVFVGFTAKGFGATDLVTVGFAAADLVALALVVTGFLAIAFLAATAAVIGGTSVSLESCPSGVLVVARILGTPFVGSFDIVGPPELNGRIPLAFVGALSTSSVSSSES